MEIRDITRTLRYSSYNRRWHYPAAVLWNQVLTSSPDRYRRGSARPYRSQHVVTMETKGAGHHSAAPNRCLDIQTGVVSSSSSGSMPYAIRTGSRPVLDELESQNGQDDVGIGGGTRKVGMTAIYTVRPLTTDHYLMTTDH